VTSTLLVDNVPGVLADVDVTLDIMHDFDSDLRVRLLAPDATSILLFEGTGGHLDGFVQTTLDDEAVTSIIDGAAPFTGAFRPMGTLGALDGKDPNGTWTLEITDDEPANEGTLRGWSLTVVTSIGPEIRRFDFGTPTSPLAAGHTRVAHNTVYSAALGYGWLSGTIGSRDRTTGGDLGRDFCFTPSGTFAVDLPAGSYQIDLVTGTARPGTTSCCSRSKEWH